MKRSAEGLAPARATTTATTAGSSCRLLLLLLLLAILCCCSGCDASLLLEDVVEGAIRNVTVFSDNVCVKSVLEQRGIVYHNLDLTACLDDSSGHDYRFVAVEARIYDRCADNHEWSVLVNTVGELVNTRDSSNETVVDYIDAVHHHFYGHLDIPLPDRASVSPWVVGFYSNCGPVQYSLKAWCSPTPGCNISCSDPESAPCISREYCRCSRSSDDDLCLIDVEDLPDEEDLVTRNGLSQFLREDIVSYGSWKYFRFQVFNNASRILVEMQRAYGDAVLYVKHEGSNGALPVEQDAYEYADLASFQNRLSHHHVFINGSGNFYIGVYNTDRCIEEDSTFNLTINVATPSDNINLCPFNCSFPQGQCLRDDFCSCDSGYGGRYCESALYIADAKREVHRGELRPGEWAYIDMDMKQVSENGGIEVDFNCSTGHPILIAQHDRLPTLKDFYLRFSNSTLGATPSGKYRINGTLRRLVLGVFNIDYATRGVSEFSIAIVGTKKAMSLWIILLVALGILTCLLALLAIVRLSMSSRSLDSEAISEELEMVQQGDGDRVLVSTLPLLAFQQGVLSEEETGCSICLSRYRKAEVVCRLPGCRHMFHIRCLDEWFQTHDVCPLCRMPLRTQTRDSSSSSSRSSSPEG